MTKEKDGTYYVLGIKKADNTRYRTIARFIENDNGRAKYSDLKTLKEISALAKGSIALIISRCFNAPIDTIIECEPFPFLPNFINQETGEQLDFEKADEATRIKAVNMGLEVFDFEQQKRREIKREIRKAKNTPIRMKK